MAPQPLPDEAVVVRGGRATGAKLLRGSDDHPDGVFGFSVQAAERSVDELARAGRLPHPRIGVTTVRSIREAGYDVWRTGGRGFHATVEVPREWDEARAQRLADIFDDQPNPSGSN